MDLRDRDLISIQQARELVARAAAAQKRFSTFSQQQVDAIVEACAAAATEAAESLARVAVEETGYGNVPDKILKNRVASVEVPRAIREMRTVGVVREDAKASSWKPLWTRQTVLLARARLFDKRVRTVASR